jgi:cellulose synthase operon protein C
MTMSDGRFFARIKMLLAACSVVALTACSTPEERATAHFESGKELLQNGEHIRAILEFRNAVRLNDKLAAAWQGLADAEEKRQNWPAVNESLQRVIELDAKNFDAIFKIGKLQLAAIQLDNALKSANAANELKPNDSDVAALRAAILLRLNDKEGAIQEAERSLSFNPNNPDALSVLAAEAMSRNNSAGAYSFISRGLQADPKNIGLLLFKVKLHEDGNQDKELEETLRTLIKYYPEQREFRQSLMSFLLQIGRTDDVEKELRQYIQTDPTDVAAGLDLVRLVARLRGSEPALAELSQLATQHTSVVQYKLALARMQFSQKQQPAAETTLGEIIDKAESPGNVHSAKLLLSEFRRMQNKQDDADKLVEEVIAEDAKNSDALTIRAAAKLDKNDTAGAITDLREALDQKPDSTQIKLVLARAYERQGAIELAIDQFGQGLKASNYNPDVALQYVDLLKRRGKTDAMELVLTEALNRNPTSLPLISALAEVRLNKGDWKGADQIATTILKYEPNSELGKRIKAGVQLGQNQFDESITTLKDAMGNTADGSAGMMSAMVTAYMRAGKLKEAEDFVSASLAANSKNLEAAIMLGNIKAAQKQPVEAEELFQKAIELNPRQPAAYFAMARMFASEKRTDEAVDVLLKARGLTPPDLGSSLLLASIYESRGQVEDAIKIYEQQLLATPDALVIVNNLASLLADHRPDGESQARAQALARRLESIDLPHFKDTVGWIAFKTGDYRTAATTLQDAVKKLPEVPSVNYHLGMTFAAMRRVEDAKIYLEKASSLLSPGDPLNAAVDAALAKLKAPATTTGSVTEQQ